MRKAFIFSFLLISYLGISAQNAVPAADANEPQAHIEFKSLVHDFGKIAVNSKAECEFKFKNTGSVPLILSNVKASCGCTVPEWPKEPILPGESGVIKVNYTTVTRPNVINKSIMVYSNADNKQIVLRIQGEVVPEG
jgi:hypothetical protein